jgi:hypothetical protein
MKECWVRFNVSCCQKLTWPESFVYQGRSCFAAASWLLTHVVQLKAHTAAVSLATRCHTPSFFVLSSVGANVPVVYVWRH